MLFTLLFVYVFGSGVPIHGGSYTDFAIGGLLLMNLVTSAVGTAVGLVTDLTTGAVERFGTLPMWRPAVLVGRSIADLVAAALCSAIVVATGLVIGWRATAGIGSVLAAFGVALAFAYALSWACACLGIVSKGPESAQGIGFIVVFPLAFVSDALVPTAGMPAWLRTVANWNPVSVVATAVRHLFGNPVPPVVGHPWPLEHPVIGALAWSGLLLAVFVPLAAHLYHRRTVG